MILSRGVILAFRQEVYDYYEAHGRHTLPWRQPGANGNLDPYKILVSEIMLQQTQVPRVIPKYQEFLTLFPSVEVLAQAELGQVLRMWSGLGYNRRAKYLYETAKAITSLESFPITITELVKLPGIGKNTAGAIIAYAYNEPITFIETNIRTVYIHHFFSNQMGVTDTAITELLKQTLDNKNPRNFYWALMDYGSYLKRTRGNLNKSSKHYTMQSTFHGSGRQIRGKVLRLLADSPRTLWQLSAVIQDKRLQSVVSDLVQEGLIRHTDETYYL